MNPNQWVGILRWWKCHPWSKIRRHLDKVRKILFFFLNHQFFHSLVLSKMLFSFWLLTKICELWTVSNDSLCIPIEFPAGPRKSNWPFLMSLCNSNFHLLFIRRFCPFFFWWPLLEQKRTSTSTFPMTVHARFPLNFQRQANLNVTIFHEPVIFVQFWFPYSSWFCQRQSIKVCVCAF